MSYNVYTPIEETHYSFGVVGSWPKLSSAMFQNKKTNRNINRKSKLSYLFIRQENPEARRMMTLNPKVFDRGIV